MWIKGPFPTWKKPPLGIFKFDFNWKSERNLKAVKALSHLMGFSQFLKRLRPVIPECSTWKIPGSVPRCGNCGPSNLQKEI